tara:strand:+ start:4112 stop:4567 length:456 start_codon:yes stop_codon:yes gene_type:complete
MIRNAFLIVLILSLFGCGYNSIYTTNEKANFTISSIEIEGDKYINNYIKSRLSKYQKNETNIKYELKINSSYNKIPIAKNKTGKITKYELTASINLEIKGINNSKSFSISESFKIDNNSDSFEQSKYEREIKGNLSNLILEKIKYNLIYFE